METETTLFKFFDGKPERWTKGWFARTKKGTTINTGHKDAVCFCLHGAAQFNFKDDEKCLRVLKKVEETLRKQGSPFYNAIDWNDAEETTFEDFMTVLKQAGV